MAYPNDAFSDTSTIGINPNPILSEYNRYASKMGMSRLFDLESQLLRGTMAFSPDRLRELDPSYTGYTQIFILRTPPILAKPAGMDGSTSGQVFGFDRGDLITRSTSSIFSAGQRQDDVAQGRYGATGGYAKAKAVCDDLRALIEMGCTSYSGTPDLTLNTTQVNTGFADRQYSVPTYSEFGSTTFTMNVLEVRGDPLRKGIEYYIGAVNDPSIKAAMMNGATLNSRLIAPSLPNYTWTFMIVQSDQSMLNIQDISIWTNVLITQVDRSNLDWDSGTIDIVQPRTLQCTGNYIPDSENPAIFQIARALMKRRMRYYRRFSDMTSHWLGMHNWDSRVQNLMSDAGTPGGDPNKTGNVDAYDSMINSNGAGMSRLSSYWYQFDN